VDRGLEQAGEGFFTAVETAVAVAVAVAALPPATEEVATGGGGAQILAATNDGAGDAAVQRLEEQAAARVSEPMAVAEAGDDADQVEVRDGPSKLIEAGHVCRGSWWHPTSTCQHRHWTRARCTQATACPAVFICQFIPDPIPDDWWFVQQVHDIVCQATCS
jgi:hypothetical protein